MSSAIQLTSRLHTDRFKVVVESERLLRRVKRDVRQLELSVGAVAERLSVMHLVLGCRYAINKVIRKSG